MVKRKASANFGDQLKQLEGLVSRLEQGDLPLEQALQEYENGIKLARTCEEALKAAELRVQVLREQNGTLYTEPLDPDADL